MTAPCIYLVNNLEEDLKKTKVTNGGSEERQQLGNLPLDLERIKESGEKPAKNKKTRKKASTREIPFSHPPCFIITFCNYKTLRLYCAFQLF